MNKQKIKVDVVSDINCPWCYLGEKRLQKAMKEAGEQFEFEVTFKPFELNPKAPAGGEKKEDYFIRNYGKEALQRLEGGNRQLSEMGRAEGAIFNFEKSAVVHNTFNGHRLIWLAEQYGVQEAVVNALFKSNFTEGENVNDIKVLQEIGAANNIPAEKLENFFNSNEGAEEVRAMEAWAQKSGINGVPAFIFNNQYLVSGAQPADTLKSVFSQLTSSLEEIKTEGPGCGPEGDC